MVKTLTRRALTGALSGLLLAMAGAAATAAPGRAVHLTQQDQAVTLEEAAARVRAQTGGRILSAETRDQDGSRVHRIKVLTEDQRVRIIHVDPRTGEQR